MKKIVPTTELIKASAAPSLPRCILLPGWGSTRDIWRPLVSVLKPLCDCLLVDLPYLSNDMLTVEPESEWADSVSEHLAPLVDNNSVLMGWSLGGMLATRIAATKPTLGLVTFATNVSFVQRKDWLNAMSDDVFQNFYAQVERAPLKTLKRFIALQTQGDELASELRQLLQVCLPVFGADDDNLKTQLLAGLKLLHSIDNRNCLQSDTNTRALHFLGEHDAVVPIDVANAIAAVNPRQQSYKVAGAGHCLPGAPEKLRSRLLDYLGQL